MRISLIIAVVLVGWSTAHAADESSSSASVVIEGRIWTADAHKPWAEALAIQGDKILAVGSREDVAKYRGEKSRVIAAGDGMVVPGMIDSHIHLIDGGLRLSCVQLRDAASREEFVRRLSEFAKKQER